MKKQKLRDIFLMIMNTVLTIVPYLLLGLELGLMLADMEETDTGTFLFYFAGAYISVMVWYLIHIVIHETGHLLAGMYSGWTCSSFRIGKNTWMKENGKIVRKKMTVKGTAGQCLMSPPKCVPAECPFTFYLLGGGLLNILVAVICIGLYYIFPQNMVTMCTLLACGIGGMVTGISNLFPAKAGGMVNDGYNACIDLPGNTKAREAQYYLLSLVPYIMSEEKIEDIPAELVKDIMQFEYDDITSIGVCNLYNNKAFLHFAKEEYEEDEKCQHRILETEGVLELFKNEARCNLLFYAILRNDTEETDNLYNKKLQQYITVTAGYPFHRCLMYAYYLVYKKDMDKAEKEWEALLKTVDTHPSRMEIASSIALAESIREGTCRLLKSGEEVSLEKETAAVVENDEKYDI